MLRIITLALLIIPTCIGYTSINYDDKTCTHPIQYYYFYDSCVVNADLTGNSSTTSCNVTANSFTSYYYPNTACSGTSIYTEVQNLNCSPESGGGTHFTEYFCKNTLPVITWANYSVTYYYTSPNCQGDLLGYLVNSLNECHIGGNQSFYLYYDPPLQQVTQQVYNTTNCTGPYTTETAYPVVPCTPFSQGSSWSYRNLINTEQLPPGAPPPATGFASTSAGSSTSGSASSTSAGSSTSGSASSTSAGSSTSGSASSTSAGSSTSGSASSTSAGSSTSGSASSTSGGSSSGSTSLTTTGSTSTSSSLLTGLWSLLFVVLVSLA